MVNKQTKTVKKTVKKVVKKDSGEKSKEEIQDVQSQEEQSEKTESELKEELAKVKKELSNEKKKGELTAYRIIDPNQTVYGQMKVIEIEDKEGVKSSKKLMFFQGKGHQIGAKCPETKYLISACKKLGYSIKELRKQV